MVDERKGLQCTHSKNIITNPLLPNYGLSLFKQPATQQRRRFDREEISSTTYGRILLVASSHPFAVVVVAG